MMPHAGMNHLIRRWKSGAQMEKAAEAAFSVEWRMDECAKPAACAA